MRRVAVSEGKGEKRNERDGKSSAQLRYAYIYNSERTRVVMLCVGRETVPVSEL